MKINPLNADSNLEVADKLIGKDLWVKIYNPDYSAINNTAFLHVLHKYNRSYGYDNKMWYKCEIIPEYAIIDGGYDSEDWEVISSIVFYNEFDMRTFIFQDEFYTTEEIQEMFEQ